MHSDKLGRAKHYHTPGQRQQSIYMSHKGIVKNLNLGLGGRRNILWNRKKILELMFLDKSLDNPWTPSNPQKLKQLVCFSYFI